MAVAEHQRRHYGLEVDPDSEVQVTFGATEGLAAALLALVGDGDEVLTLDPAYDSYGAIVELAGGPGATDRARAAGLARARVSRPGRRARVLLLNSPHNPTGRVLDEDELELLARLCREHDLIALTDEVYEHLVYDGRHVPLATLPGMWERTLTVSSLGKTHSLTGWKVGWVTGPAELVGRVRAVKQFLTFAGGTPLQYAAAVGHGARPGPAGGGAARQARPARRRPACGGLRGAAVGRDLLPERDAGRRRTRRACASRCRTRPAWRRSRCRRSASGPKALCGRSCALRSASAKRFWTRRSSAYATGNAGSRGAEPEERSEVCTTGAIVAIVVAALIVIALLVLSEPACPRASPGRAP